MSEPVGSAVDGGEITQQLVNEPEKNLLKLSR